MRSITLIISGGIAGYKALELIRLLRKAHIRVLPVLTKGGAEFVTPLSVSALAEEKVRMELFSLEDESARAVVPAKLATGTERMAQTNMGHIALSRASDLVVVAPASADILAKMAQGRADDLATTILLASNRPIVVAPAMNPQMWASPATQANMALLKARGVMTVGPGVGEAACGEEGTGRMAEPEDIFAVLQTCLSRPGPLSGRKALVTAGPTLEPIDPVRFIANRSSGKQGYAMAEALYEAGADVTLVSGPTSLASPEGVGLVKVETARQMLDAVLAELPADIAVCAAAVSDWRVKEAAAEKIKKTGAAPVLALEENPDILKTLAQASNRRPAFVLGFAAETGDMEKNAAAKLRAKNCDAIVANDVSGDVFGSDGNEALLLWRGKTGAVRSEKFPRMEKTQLAKLLVQDIVTHFQH